MARVVENLDEGRYVAPMESDGLTDAILGYAGEMSLNPETE
jgi:hypothetical protein